MAVEFTESLPNLKTSIPPKYGDTMEASTHAAYKAFGRRNPCVVMKRTDAIHPMQFRSATEDYSSCKGIGGCRRLGAIIR